MLSCNLRTKIVIRSLASSSIWYTVHIHILYVYIYVYIYICIYIHTYIQRESAPDPVLKDRVKKLIWLFWDLESGFWTFPAGSREDFVRRFRI